MCAVTDASALQASDDTSSDDFFMYVMKVQVCTKGCGSRGWSVCPFAHLPFETGARRDLRMYRYSSVRCPDHSKTSPCPRGCSCPYAHSVFEERLHPEKFRTEMCNMGAACNRKMCFFAHLPSQLRTPSPHTASPTAAAPRASTATAPPRRTCGGLERHDSSPPGTARSGASSSGSSSRSGSSPRSRRTHPFGAPTGCKDGGGAQASSRQLAQTRFPLQRALHGMASASPAATATGRVDASLLAASLGRRPSGAWPQVLPAHTPGYPLRPLALSGATVGAGGAAAALAASQPPPGSEAVAGALASWARGDAASFLTPVGCSGAAAPLDALPTLAPRSSSVPFSADCSLMMPPATMMAAATQHQLLEAQLRHTHQLLQLQLLQAQMANFGIMGAASALSQSTYLEQLPGSFSPSMSQGCDWASMVAAHL